MRSFLFAKEKLNQLNSSLYTSVLKKIIITSHSNLLNSGSWRKSYLSILDRNSFVGFKKHTLLYGKNRILKLFFLKSLFFFSDKLLSSFFSNDQFQFTIAVNFTRFNFSISTFSNISNIESQPWRLFLRKNMTAGNSTVLLKPELSSVPQLSSTHYTFSAGQGVKRRKSRVTFENFNLGIQCASLVISMFWSFLSSSISRQFKFSIKVKGKFKWIKSIIYSVRRSFRKLCMEHRWYITRYQNALPRHATKQYTLSSADIEKYKYSMLRLKKIYNCPLFFESINLVKSIPHNGCRLRKSYLRCKDIKRINSRRRTR